MPVDDSTSWRFLDLLTRIDRDWVKRAACRNMDPNLFFPSQGEPGADAKAACSQCPVRQECLEYALTTGIQFGIWGGMAERRRRAMRRDRRQQRSIA